MVHDEHCRTLEIIEETARVGPAEALESYTQYKKVRNKKGTSEKSRLRPRRFTRTRVAVSRLTDNDRPSQFPLAPVTPRWRRRYLGVGAVAALFAALGWGAWHYTHRVPASGSNDVPVPPSR